MVETAAHLVGYVLPAVLVRQWVISLTKRQRNFPARQASLLNRMVQIAFDDVQRAVYAVSPLVPGNI